VQSTAFRIKQNLQKNQLNNFFIFFSAFLLLIILINLGADPYSVFRVNYGIDLYSIKPQNAAVILKAYKNLKNDTVCIGGSEFNPNSDLNCNTS